MKALGKHPAIILSSLLALDALLAVVAFFAPDFWFQFFHGVPYNDPEGLLRRAGGAWAAFALVQGIALAKWRKDPRWLWLAAGLRFGDMFTDWTYLAFAHDLTPAAWVLLAIASPGNILAGWLLISHEQQKSAQAL